jgi:hypothetical protein
MGGRADRGAWGQSRGACGAAATATGALLHTSALSPQMRRLPCRLGELALQALDLPLRPLLHHLSALELALPAVALLQQLRLPRHQLLPCTWCHTAADTTGPPTLRGEGRRVARERGGGSAAVGLAGASLAGRLARRSTAGCCLGRDRYDGMDDHLHARQRLGGALLGLGQPRREPLHRRTLGGTAAAAAAAAAPPTVGAAAPRRRVGGDPRAQRLVLALQRRHHLRTTAVT